jgi:hypothetical protein
MPFSSAILLPLAASSFFVAAWPRCGQTSPKEAAPGFALFFHHSPFKIHNSPSVPIEVNQGQSGKRNSSEE